MLMITQPPQSATSYYKIAPGNLITFGWNASYIIVRPTSLTVSAFCNNGNHYPVGPDPSGRIPGDATEVVWDPYAYQTAHSSLPLPQDVCTLAICDERDYTASRRAGYLSPNTQLQFAMYTPQPYTPLASGWTCAICNSGMSTAAHPVFVSLVVTLFICFFSGLNLIRRGNVVRVHQD
ncbi:hypothetical protein DFP72DRAFT_901749 [Ephemerocybe angulata]|uniref:DUF7137 domain-containing protein n=1 Tax=Ephemerocybe angulata TaxID=980116 RepID=A0A8H6HV66_9AGAR|nr:hypothetical protein DFP72DRAFT_901749 [Tulosesus angulatus]